MHKLSQFMFVALFVIVSCGCSQAKEFYVSVPKGQTKDIWGRMCDTMWCLYNVCMKFENNSYAPARAIITIDALIMSDHEKQPVTASGNYCSPRKNFTFGMTYTVSVQAPDEDVNVTFYEEDNYQQ